MIKIMAVDDAPEISSLVTDVLNPYGYEVVPALNADEAMRKLLLEPVDLILLDVMMPGKNGFDFCEELKKTALAPIPVIMITVKRDQKDFDRAKQVGAADYIVKPFEPDDLVKKIKQTLKIA